MADLGAFDTTNVVVLQFPGATIDVDLSAFDGADWRDAKAATGLHDRQLVVDAVQWGDRDATAALAWLWLRREDPDVTFEATLLNCHYGPVPADPDDD